MRLFIAIDVEQLKDYFLIVQKKLISERAAFPKQFHLTLKFLGEVGEDKINEIKRRLQKIKSFSFTATTAEIGAFLTSADSGVVWIGVEPKQKFIELQQNLDKSFKDLFKKEKHFEPHITLARMKLISGEKELHEKIRGIKLCEKEFCVDNLKLFRSILTPKGAVHEELFKLKFYKQTPS